MRGDPLQADEAKLFFLPLKREEFVLQAEEAGAVLQALAIPNRSEMGSSSLFLTYLCGRSSSPALVWAPRLSQRTERPRTAASGSALAELGAAAEASGCLTGRANDGRCKNTLRKARSRQLKGPAGVQPGSATFGCSG